MLQNTNLNSKEFTAESEDMNEADEPCELVDMDEDLQNQVGVLWDMTANEVRLLITPYH